MRLVECPAVECDHLDVTGNQYLVAEMARAGHFGPTETAKRLIDGLSFPAFKQKRKSGGKPGFFVF